ncbi:MAG: RagB/SusD family nutrient uptake outer membrane protein, partial [Bacteroidales bacterium]|nr:RagB/SusD family nutrient uptake outer membrane protein [Bacteroidales bacterium]
LAEQYLIRAEARLKAATPDIAGACADINVIRSRAGLPDTDLTDAAALLRLIEQERRYELAFEGHRFNDIVRTGRAAEVFGAYDPVFKDANYWVLPFPNNAILADEDLEQNPGY